MNPGQWLHDLAERPNGYRLLLDQAGGLSKAAWLLARAKCQAGQVATDVPTRHEIGAAARVIARRVGLADLPTTAALVSECESSGLLVI